MLSGDDPDRFEIVRDLTGGGADYAFEAIGSVDVINSTPDYLIAGGSAVLVGMAPMHQTASFDPFLLADQAKTIIGCNYGSSVPSRDFPELARLYADGKMPLDKLIQRTRPLVEADLALGDLRSATGLRTLLLPHG